jgi:hypothetical protein
LDAERAIGRRAADSFALRAFRALVFPEAPPESFDDSAQASIDCLETHEAVITWMLQRVAGRAALPLRH